MKKIYNEYVEFMGNSKSVYISSISEHKGGVAPEISYSPCIVDEDKNIYILVSTLSKRTKSLLTENNVSLMFIEPEEQCEEIYVRTRLIFLCSTSLILRWNGVWWLKIPLFKEKFGDIRTVNYKLRIGHTMGASTAVETALAIQEESGRFLSLGAGMGNVFSSVVVEIL